jgi:pyruvate/2-oxoglutarate dehydrogenase complex dihydrolipoamide dehydrogenase (E3) component
MATSAPTYDLVAIGGGTAGLVTAFGAAGLGARVALIERDRLGGDCLNVGCVPSKALLRSARAVRDVRRAAVVGVRAAEPVVDFAAVMARVDERRAILAPNDSAERLAAAGIDVYFGEAAFAGPEDIVIRTAERVHDTNARVSDQLTVRGGAPGEGTRRIRFRRAVIATGSRPAVPSIPGLSEAGYHTNETIFELTAQPRRLIVIGAGAIGCELAQAFALLGTHVTVADVVDRPLSREDPDASVIVRRALEADGVRFHLGRSVDLAALNDRATHTDSSPAAHDPGATSDRAAPGQRVVAAPPTILVAAGRTPNVESLNLEAAGVHCSRDGISVNDRLQTTNRRIFAAGDVASPYKFTHVADATARIAIRNALFFGRARSEALVVPWCTYTMPEVARVGELAGDALTIPLRDVDRAVLDGEVEGFVRVHHRRRRIVGCTIVAPHAGELIGQVVHVMRTGGGLGQLSDTIAPYPTYSEAFRKAGDAWRRTLLTPVAKSLLHRYFALFR